MRGSLLFVAVSLVTLGGCAESAPPDVVAPLATGAPPAPPPVVAAPAPSASAPPAAKVVPRQRCNPGDPICYDY